MFAARDFARLIRGEISFDSDFEFVSRVFSLGVFSMEVKARRVGRSSTDRPLDIDWRLFCGATKPVGVTDKEELLKFDDLDELASNPLSSKSSSTKGIDTLRRLACVEVTAQAPERIRADGLNFGCVGSGWSDRMLRVSCLGVVTL